MNGGLAHVQSGGLGKGGY